MSNFFKKKLNVLHIAPEQVFFKKFKNFENWNYTTCDLNSPLADIKSDICNLPFKNNFFDKMELGLENNQGYNSRRIING